MDSQALDPHNPVPSLGPAGPITQVGAMAPRERQVDLGWAESLLGLQLKVPGGWWGGEGCSNDRNTYTGTLKRFDQSSQKWVFSVIGGTGEYGMAYSASTLEYVGVGQLALVGTVVTLGDGARPQKGCTGCFKGIPPYILKV